MVGVGYTRIFSFLFAHNMCIAKLSSSVFFHEEVNNFDNTGIITKTDRGRDETIERKITRFERSNKVGRLEAAHRDDVDGTRRVAFFPVRRREHRDGQFRSESARVHVFSANGGAKTGRGAVVYKLVPKGFGAPKRAGESSGAESDVEHSSESDCTGGGFSDSEMRGGRVATREEGGGARDTEDFSAGPVQSG